MRKAHHQLIDDSILRAGLRNRNQFEIWWDIRDEMIGVEITHSVLADASCTGRDKEDIGIFGQGRQRYICVFEYEFSIEVLLQDGQHPFVSGRNIIHWKFLSSARAVTEGTAPNLRNSLLISVFGGQIVVVDAWFRVRAR